MKRAFDEEEIVSACGSTECSSTTPCSTTSSESRNAYMYSKLPIQSNASIAHLAQDKSTALAISSSDSGIP